MLIPTLKRKHRHWATRHTPVPDHFIEIWIMQFPECSVLHPSQFLPQFAGIIHRLGNSWSFILYLLRDSSSMTYAHHENTDSHVSFKVQRCVWWRFFYFLCCVCGGRCGRVCDPLWVCVCGSRVVACLSIRRSAWCALLGLRASFCSRRGTSHLFDIIFS